MNKKSILIGSLALLTVTSTFSCGNKKSCEKSKTNTEHSAEAKCGEGKCGEGKCGGEK